MKVFLLVIEFITSVALIGAVLMNSAKGEGLAGIGGQAKMFNSAKGLDSGLHKVTAVLAIVFMTVAAILGIFF